MDSDNKLQYVRYIAFHSLDQSFAETKDWDQMAQLWSQSDVEINQSQQRVIADVIGDSSLILTYFFVYFWISEKVKWFSLIKT